MTAGNPNTVLYAVIACAGISVAAAALLAAHAHGRRQERRAWLIEQGNAT